MKLFKKWRDKKFARNKADAENKMNMKKAELESFASAISEMIRPKPLEVDIVGTMGTYDSSRENSNEPVYFYDFLKEWQNNGSTVFSDSLPGDDTVPTPSISITPQSHGALLGISESLEQKEPKIVIKPIEVYQELGRIPNPVSLENLDEKIATFKMRQKFIRNNSYSTKEVIDMTTRLENRKKYEEHKEFFEKFDYTTTEKISALLSKYDVVLKSTDLFIPTFPAEAIQIMEDYNSKVIELCNKKPVFYVIAENSQFKKEYERNDPILLVQSPFGIFWNILGAWDKEILLLSEL